MLFMSLIDKLKSIFSQGEGENMLYGKEIVKKENNNFYAGSWATDLMDTDDDTAWFGYTDTGSNVDRVSRVLPGTRA